MKILEFIKNLLPHIDKTKVVEDARITIAELDNIVIPSYKNATDALKMIKLVADTNKDKTVIFYRNIDLQNKSKQGSFIADIYLRLPYIKENTEFLLEQVEELMERDIINEGLTAKKAILLRALGSMSFISRFSIDLLNAVYVEESLFISKDGEETTRLSPAVTKYIDTNFPKYIKVLSEYGIPNKVFVKIIGELPEITISSKNSNGIAGLYKESDIDPFASAYISHFTNSPIYTISLMVAEWQSSRYKANKDKKRMLELRLLRLRMINEDKKDPKLQQEIDYIQGRVDRISRRLAEIEESSEED